MPLMNGTHKNGISWLFYFVGYFGGGCIFENPYTHSLESRGTWSGLTLIAIQQRPLPF